MAVVQQLIRRARLVGATKGTSTAPGLIGPPEPVDILLSNGRIAAVGPDLPATGVAEIDADGRWASPGLWDNHVHLGQWTVNRGWIDLSGTDSPEDVLDRVRQVLPTTRPGQAIFGFGFRIAVWEERAEVAALDAMCNDRPIILISGDAHNGWLNTNAQQVLGASPHESVIEELEWFDIYARVGEVFDVSPTVYDYSATIAAAHRMGVVGVVDLEFEPGFRRWAERIEQGVAPLRVRSGVYPVDLDDVIAAGLRSGDPIAGSELVRMGPLKIISDGALNTRTAYCCQPYTDSEPGNPLLGTLNYSRQEVTELMRRATEAGLEVAIHGIGDAATRQSLDAFEATGARGSIEHGQLVRYRDIRRIAALGVRASVQPAHLLDDRDVAMHCWSDRTDRCFSFASMLQAGVDLRMGSDAPVAPLDPWLAMAAAVHRSADDREPWHPEQNLTAHQAWLASLDQPGPVAFGKPADVVLLDRDPLHVQGGRGVGVERDTGRAAQWLRQTMVELTVVNGEVVHSAL